MSFARYPSYKTSKISWLGDVPEHWETSRLRFVAEINPSKGEIGGLPRDTPVSFLPMEAIGVDGSLRLDIEKQVGDVENGYTYFRNGDVVFAKITPCFENGKGARLRNLVNGIGFGTTELIVVRPTPNRVLAAYLHYLFRSREFLSMGESFMYGAGGQKRVPDAFVRNFVNAYPPLSEQQQLVEFLDREIAKIDSLMAEQRRLIDLLKEKRQALISHAVTKGLDPAVSTKQSGVMWIGEMPEHWQISQSRRMFAVRSEPALASDKMMTASQRYGVLYQADFVEMEGRRVAEVIMGIEYLKHVEPDDFVISMRSFQGGIEWCRLRGSTSFHYVMVRPVKGVYPPFFAHLFKSHVYIQALRATTDLIRDGQELRFSNFVQVDLPLVPMEEQRQIAAFLDRETMKLDVLTGEAQRAIELLQERRTALISAVITGQIDVRPIQKQVIAA